MGNPLVSVIIPIYKVEPYLPKCLDSVINQTYNNLEIILVDDGSPDNCGAICDAYKAKDERIIVIHQANKGLSMARNAGLDICTGEYIAFVDSDDWVEPEYIESMLETVEDDTIVACGVTIHGEQYLRSVVIENNIVITGHEVIEAYLLENPLMEYVFFAVWNKLFSRKMFEKLRFPKGLLYEDLYIFIDIFAQIEKLKIINVILYNYRNREGSITKSLTKKSFFDINLALDRHEYLLKDKSGIAEIINKRRFNCCCNELRAVYSNRLNLKELELKEVQENLISYMSKLENPTFKLYMKAYLLLYCPPLFMLLFNIKNKYLSYLRCLYKKIFFSPS